MRLLAAVATLVLPAPPPAAPSAVPVSLDETSATLSAWRMSGRADYDGSRKPAWYAFRRGVR